jgi:hypothetical protein
MKTDLVSETMLHGKSAAMPCPAWRQFLWEFLLLLFVIFAFAGGIVCMIWFYQWCNLN